MMRAQNDSAREQALLTLRKPPISPENASRIMRERDIASLVICLSSSKGKANERHNVAAHDETDFETIREVGLLPTGMESLLHSPDEREQ
jgi:hypothetical protein